MYKSIRPGQPWLDTAGKLIQAHGGSIITVGDTFYWYGENKEKTRPGSGIWHWGVKCYASKDLYNWEDKGIIIPPDEEDDQSPLHISRGMDRPHIIYNKKTKKYVCWIKIMAKGGLYGSTVLVADDILGPYTMIRKWLHPGGMHAGDFDLAVDEQTGKGYYIFERVHSDLIIMELNHEYTDVTSVYSEHFPHQNPPYVREAPAYFRRNNKHYLFTSGTSGYHPNPSEAACAKSWHGPWTVLGDPHAGDSSRTSFNSQISSVFRHPWKKDLYIALADRWIVDLPELAGNKFWSGGQYEIAKRAMEKIFSGKDIQLSEEENIVLKDIDTSIAGYVWLPVRFDGDRPYIEWVDEWRIEDYI